jgi:DNA processing protein
MNQSTALLWSWTNVMKKKRYDALIEVYGSLNEAANHINDDLLKRLGCQEETIYKTLNRLEEFDVSAYAKELEKRQLSLITIEDEQYPKRLREIPDPPVFLYTYGDLALLDQPCIGIVGTREMSPYGKRVIQEFVPPLVSAGMVTVSGLALGIDTQVARETLHTGGKTVSILGNGLAQIFPKSNAPLAKEILAHGGLIMSEYAIDISPDKYTFPARNRIIAALSLGTLVAEAPIKSGALITTDLALQYGRDVFAVPGSIFDPNFAGCHHIISKGHAKLVSTPEDILEELGISTCHGELVEPYTPKNPEEEVIFKTLTTLPQHLDDIVQKAKMDAAKTNAALTMMEIAGAVKNVESGWVRV